MLPGEIPRRRSGCLRRVLNLLLFLLLVSAVAGYIVYTWLYIYPVLRPVQRSICCETPADWGFEYQDVTLKSTDSVTLYGWYIPSQNGAAIILLHGYWGYRRDMASHAKYLAEAGYGVLIYDMRGHGESIAEWRSRGWQDVTDVGAAIEFLQQNGVEQIGILGLSIGGQVAIRAAAEYPEILAMVADGAWAVTAEDLKTDNSLTSNLKLLNNSVRDYVTALWLKMQIPESVLEEIPEIAPRPVLLIAGTKDESERARIRQFYNTASQPKTLWEVPEAGHGGVYNSRPEEYQEQVLTFFNTALLKTPDNLN